VTRASKYTPGSDRYPIMAMFTMLAKSMAIPASEVLKSIYDLKTPYVKGYKKNLMNIRIEYVKRLLGSLLHPNRVLNFTKNPILSEIWNVEDV
jgi:hypothetical protein